MQITLASTLMQPVMIQAAIYNLLKEDLLVVQIVKFLFNYAKQSQSAS